MSECSKAGNTETAPESFADALRRHGLELKRDRTHTLQINVGLLCDLSCRHCHLEAGPLRTETMSRETMDAVIAYASRAEFETIDVTGGAPELLPGIDYFLGALAPLAGKLIVRTNLVALHRGGTTGLMRLYRDLRLTVAASLPSINAAEADSQRGEGVWAKSMAVLGELNALGYGEAGSGLDLDLVANPAGAFLPDDQIRTQNRYRRELQRRGIAFSNLFTFANMPMGRFRKWLVESGILEGYERTLVERFNPGVVCGLMCRSLISVDWNGFLYDCDFNLALGVHHGAHRIHLSRMAGLPKEGTPIPHGDHCYTCTAGAGFT